MSQDNATPKTDMELWGADAVVIEIPARTVAQFIKVRNWFHSQTPEKFRPTLETFIASEITDAGKAREKYVEAQAYGKLEKLVFAYAKLNNVTPIEAAEKLGVQLRDQK